MVSVLTNILGPLIPDIIRSFNLSLAMAGFLPFSFFIAYGVMSIPSGILVEKYHEKTVLLSAFMLSLFGSLLFAVFTEYSVAIISLLMIGCGMAMTQVSINPLLRTAGGEENFAFNSVLGQLIFGTGSFVSPHVYSYLVVNLKSIPEEPSFIISVLSGLVPTEFSWVSVYWFLSLLCVIMLAVLIFIKMPKVNLKDEERIGAWQTHKLLLKNRQVVLFAIGIFAYVGSEQGVANWISKFLLDFHGVDPQTTGAGIVSYFWGAMTLGCLLGLISLKFYDSRKVLIIFSVFAILCLLLALFGDSRLSMICFPLIGFFLSVMWSIIFSLALNSVRYHHGSFSGILCTAITGGAVVPLIIGWLGDLFGLRIGMLLLFVTFGYILSIGFWANPLIANKVISLKDKKSKSNKVINSKN
jgi:fucose permease